MSTIRSAGTFEVYMDGIRIPADGVSFSAEIGGMTAASISIPAFEEAHQLIVGALIEVFQIDTLFLNHQRTSVELPISEAMDTRDEEVLRSVFEEECARTIGDTYACSPRSNFGGPLEEATSSDSKILRFNGIFVQKVSTAASKQSSVVIQCRGVDYLMDNAQVIQLTGGSGTLSEEERRFFGQDTDNEGESGTILAGRGRRAYADAIVEVLTADNGNIALGYRRLIAQFASQINNQTKHSFARARFASCITALDNDESVERLIEVSSFKKFMREKLQSSYVASLRMTLQTILSFVGYQVVPVLTPPYFPLVPAPIAATATRTVNETRTRTRQGRTVIRVSWSTWSYTRFSGFNEEFNISVLAGSVETQLEQGNQSVYLEIPSRFVRGFNGSGPAMYLSLDDVRFELAREEFEAGDYYGSVVLNESRAPQFFNRALAAVADAGLPPADEDETRSELLDYLRAVDFDFEISISSPPISYNVVVEVEEQYEVPPEPQRELYDSRLCRLGSYAVLPELWWACPPACNVLTPESIYSESFASGGSDRITRLLAKIPPGRSGSRTSFVDRFSAPNSSDLNRAMQEETEDPLDAKLLQKTEYINGVKAQIEYFDNLSRHAREDVWKKYIRSQIVQKFWSKRMMTEQVTIECHPHARIVIGAPLLVLKASPGSSLSQITPEQAALISRLNVLRRWLRNIEACINRYAALVARLARLVDYLEQLALLSQNARTAEPRVNEFLSANGSILADAVGLEGTQVNVAVAARTFASPLIRAAQSGERSYLEGSTEVEGETLRNRSTVNTQGIDASLLTSYIGIEALVILPAADYVESLPAPPTLMGWRTRALSRYDGFRSCLSALRTDKNLIDQAIESARELLRRDGARDVKDRSYVGYVVKIAENASSKAHGMSVTMTHLRYIGEDSNWDDLGGDDFESTIAFGGDGYLDEIYSIGRIGANVYKPVYGCGSIADTEIVQNAIRSQPPLEDSPSYVEGLPPADASDIRSVLTHPSACGHSCLEDGANGLATDPRLTLNFCAKALSDEYIRLRSNGVGSHEIVQYFERLGARVGMSIADAYRNRNSDGARTSFARSPLGRFAYDNPELPVGEVDDVQYPESVPPKGFYAESFPDSSVADKQAAISRIRFSSEYDANETELVYERQQRVLTYANAVAVKRNTAETH